MRICLITNQDLDDPTIGEHDWPCDPRPFLPDDEWDLLVLEKETAVKAINTAALEGYDLYFNLCDGAWDEETPGVEVVITLERLDVPFTGAASHFFEPTRESMKKVCHAWGIDTPRYAIVRDEKSVADAARDLRFPLFVKHPNSYASIGLTRDSRVDDEEALRVQAEKMISAYGGALVEEYVDGEEYTVLVCENADPDGDPIAYQSIQYRFPEGDHFKHSDLKWVDYDRMDAFPVEDPEVDARLRDVSARLFAGLDGTGFGRCDIRMGPDGRPFILEINPNCGVYHTPEDAGSADFCLLNDPRGHAGFTRSLVDAALARHARSRRSWKVAPTEDGFGVIATRRIGAGEIVIAFESTSHTLVTASHVAANWDAKEREWFRRYAWPLTDEVWVAWSRDPEEWIPVDHSCDPSGWIDGLDVVARRPIDAGEAITLDYATFYNEQMPAFECRCGAPACRRTIRGTDYLEDFVDRYGRHVSDYVKRKRNSLST